MQLDPDISFAGRRVRALALPCASWFLLVVLGFWPAEGQGSAPVIHLDWTSFIYGSSGEIDLTGSAWSLATNTDVEGRLIRIHDEEIESPCLAFRGWVNNLDARHANTRLVYDVVADRDSGYAFPEDGVVQWRWWVGERAPSGHVTLQVSIVQDGERRDISFASHPYGWVAHTQFTDCPRQWITHRITRSELISRDFLPDKPFVIDEIQVALVYPRHQVAKLDYIHVGPQATAPKVEDEPASCPPDHEYYSAAICNIDGDSLPDWLLPLGRATPNELYLSTSPDTRPDYVAAERGLADLPLNAAVFADIDNDGDRDLIGAGRHGDGIWVAHDTGRGRFVAHRLGFELEEGASTSAVGTADVDGDGWLDVLIATATHEDVLLMNDGSGGLDLGDAGRLPSLSEHNRSFGFQFRDLDSDGDPDIYITRLGVLENNGHGWFSPVATDGQRRRGALQEGLVFTDLDADAEWEIYVGVDVESARLDYRPRHNFMLRRDEVGHWRYRTTKALCDSGRTEALAVADFDVDGDSDLLIGNRGQEIRHLTNDGTSRLVDLGNATPFFVRRDDLTGFAPIDYDDDGDLDLLLLSEMSGYAVVDNPWDSGYWCKVKLVGVESNRDGVGARMELRHASGAPGGRDLVAVRESYPGMGFQITAHQDVHFGMPSPGPFKLTVVFPSGRVIERDDVKSGDRVTVVEAAPGFATWYWRLRRVILPGLGRTMWDFGPVANLGGIAAFTLATYVCASRFRRRQSRPVGVALVFVAAFLAGWVWWYLSNPFSDNWWVWLAMAVPIPAILLLEARRNRNARSEDDVWLELRRAFIRHGHIKWHSLLDGIIRCGDSYLALEPTDDRRQFFRDSQTDYARQLQGLLGGLSRLARTAERLTETQEVARLMQGDIMAITATGLGVEELVSVARSLRSSSAALENRVLARFSCRLADVLPRSLDVVRSRLAEKGVELKESWRDAADIHVVMDSDDLIVIMVNLLDNALAAVASSGRGVVEVGVDVSPAQVILFVEDDGLGLPDMDVEQLCAEGFSMRGSSGLGLGHVRGLAAGFAASFALEDRKDTVGARASVTMRRISPPDSTVSIGGHP